MGQGRLAIQHFRYGEQWRLMARHSENIKITDIYSEFVTLDIK